MKRLAVAALASVALGKETLELVEDGVSRAMPIVEAYPCSICAVDTTDSKLCLGYNAKVNLGWKWEQQFTDNPQTPDIIDGYYDLKLKLYSEAAVGLELIAMMANILNIAAKGEFLPFKVGGYLQMTYYTISRRTCFNLAYSIEDLNFQSNLNMMLGQCYKDIIRCLFSYENWSSKYAKWFEGCTLSAPTNTSLYSYTYQQPKKLNYLTLLGDGTDTAAGCTPGLFWRAEDPASVAGTLQHNAMMYIMDALESVYQYETESGENGSDLLQEGTLFA